MTSSDKADGHHQRLGSILLQDVPGGAGTEERNNGGAIALSTDPNYTHVRIVVEDQELMSKAMDIAERLARGPARAISASKVPINKYLKMVSNLVLPLSLSLEGATMATADAREAAQAFREKREPKFTGR